MNYGSPLQDVSALDTSFELPIDTRDDGVNGGPIPLGDEVHIKMSFVN